MIVLVLTEGQADAVRGPSASGLAALDPRDIGEGRWILPLAVLSDPEHIEHHLLLQQCETGPAENVIPPDDEG